MITVEELEERAKSVGGRLESLSDINVLIEMRDYVAGLRGRPWSRPLRFGANLLRIRAESIVRACGLLPYLSTRWGVASLFDLALEESRFPDETNPARLVSMLEQAMGQLLARPPATRPSPSAQRPSAGSLRQGRVAGVLLFVLSALVSLWWWAGVPAWALVVGPVAILLLGGLAWWWATRDLYKRVALSSLAAGISAVAAPSVSLLVETNEGRAKFAIGGGAFAGVALLALCAYAMRLHSEHTRSAGRG